jgi:hypothetical protein
MNILKNRFLFSNFHSVFIFLFFVNINIGLLAQYVPSSFYRTIKIDSAKSNTLDFRIENSNFLKNNEYFNDIVQGYTLIGYFLNPKLVYYPAKNIRMEAGVHFLKYSGVDQFTKVLPTFSFHYQASKSTEIILGTLNGTTNHEMIEPIFKYEYFFTDNVENGLQFLFDTRHYKGDIWINWQQFIFKDDNRQEIFTVGLSNRFFINKQNSLHSFSVPAQILYVHHGGEINGPGMNVTTRNNSSIGLNYSYQPENAFIKSASVESSYVLFKDMSSAKLLPYIMGYGIYTTANVKASYFDLRVSHWYGDFYLSELGDPIFQCSSTYYPGYVEPQRALITTRLMFEKNILKGLDIGAGAETYFDLYNYSIDYWYMFYINFNRDFFIKKFK